MGHLRVNEMMYFVHLFNKMNTTNSYSDLCLTSRYLFTSFRFVLLSLAFWNQYHDWYFVIITTFPRYFQFSH